MPNASHGIFLIDLTTADRPVDDHERSYCTASGGNRPRLCEKSVRKEAVGKLFNFPLRLAVKRDEEWDCASKSGGFVSIFPTGDMTPDFLPSLGRFPPHALQHHGVLP